MFLSLTALMILDLGHNNISNFEKSTLNGLFNLQYLNLESNFIELIRRTLFSEMKNLQFRIRYAK